MEQAGQAGRPGKAGCAGALGRWWDVGRAGRVGSLGVWDGGVQSRWQSPSLMLQLQQQGGGAAGQVRRHSRSCRTAAGTVGNGPATAKS